MLKTALTIAGSIRGGGAGIQTDLEALTTQNTAGVRSIMEESLLRKHQQIHLKGSRQS